MIHIIDPRQKRLFDPFEGVIPPAGRQLITDGWQGVFRHVLLELMPVGDLAQHFSRDLGAPTKELYSMAGLVFLADFHDWTAEQAMEAYIFRSDVQYALNLEPGISVSSRTVERYQKLFRDDELAAKVFEDVTSRLTDALEINITQQRLDSTHVFSNMATFGRTKLMAVAIKRFLTQVKRHTPEQYSALPEEFRRSYEHSESQLFAGVKDNEARLRSRQQAAEDLLFVIERFADCAELNNRPTYKVLGTIFHQQCQVFAGKVTVQQKPNTDRIQNPSDPDATYDGHKGAGYQVQIAETCSSANEVQLITAALPQTACETDEAAFVPMLDQLDRSGRLPEEMSADGLYGTDENVQTAEKRNVELVAPIRGRTPEVDPLALSIDDFALDERTGEITACPAGHKPLAVEHDEATETTRVVMSAENCQGCPFFNACPIHKTRGDHYAVSFSDKDLRLAGRRRELETDVFGERYAQRSGIESTNSGLKNRLGLGRLRVRGRGSVFRVILNKVTGWNVLRAAASTKMRAWVSVQVAQTLKTGESALIARIYAAALRPTGTITMARWGFHDYPHRFSATNAA
jgi:Transposase DDE domain